MLKPAAEYKEELIEKLKSSSDKNLLFGERYNVEKIALERDHGYYFVSVDSNNNIMGYFSYEVWPMPKRDGEGNGACKLRVINFTNNKSSFAQDFYELMTNHIFKPDNDIYRLTFQSFLSNPMLPAYRRFAKRYGEILYNTKKCETYRLYKDKFWANHKRV